MPELTEDQIRFLYQLLDQVSVSGEENKAMIVGIMRVLRETQENNAGSHVEGDTDAISS